MNNFSTSSDLFSRSFSLNMGGRILDLSTPAVMGIINATPDSFYDGGKYHERGKAVERIENMIREGADIIDVGGMSSRPGSKPVSAEEEIKRVIPLIEYIDKNYDMLISVDTYRPEVARRAAAAGAHIINDISALTMDSDMAKTAADCGTSVVLMHMQGTPEDMQENPVYEYVVDDIYSYLKKRCSFPT